MNSINDQESSTSAMAAQQEATPMTAPEQISNIVIEIVKKSKKTE